MIRASAPNPLINTQLTRPVASSTPSNHPERSNSGQIAFADWLAIRRAQVHRTRADNTGSASITRCWGRARRFQARVSAVTGLYCPDLKEVRRRSRQTTVRSRPIREPLPDPDRDLRPILKRHHPPRHPQHLPLLRRYDTAPGRIGISPRLRHRGDDARSSVGSVHRGTRRVERLHTRTGQVTG